MDPYQEQEHTSCMDLAIKNVMDFCPKNLKSSGIKKNKGFG
jgi:hypothetical protein